MAGRIVWTRELMQRLLQTPEELLQEEPFRSWVSAQGGLPQLYAALRALPIKPNQRKVLELLLDTPGESTALYAQRLSVHLATYYRHQRALAEALATFLNSGALDPDQPAAPAAAPVPDLALALLIDQPVEAARPQAQAPDSESARQPESWRLSRWARRRLIGLVATLLILVTLGGLIVQPAYQQCRSRLLVATKKHLTTPFKNVAALTVNPVIQTTWYVSTFDAQTFRTTDAGASWTEAQVANASPVFKSFVVDPQNPSLIYAVGTTGVYKSPDNGINWFPISQGIEALLVNALAIDPEDRQTLYIATWERGIFKSTNGGEAWQAASAGLADLQLYALAVADDQTLYVGTYQSGVWRSANNAESWQPTGLNTGEVRGLLVAPSSAEIMANVWEEGLFTSPDGGQQWQTSNLGLIDLALRSNIASHQKHAYPLYVGAWSGGLFAQSASRVGWIQLDPDLKVIRSIVAQDTQPPTLIIGALEGIFRYEIDSPAWFRCL